jgi:hypothetical protein
LKEKAAQVAGWPFHFRLAGAFAEAASSGCSHRTNPSHGLGV